MRKRTRFVAAAVVAAVVGLVGSVGSAFASTRDLAIASYSGAVTNPSLSDDGDMSTGATLGSGGVIFYVLNDTSPITLFGSSEVSLSIRWYDSTGTTTVGGGTTVTMTPTGATLTPPTGAGQVRLYNSSTGISVTVNEVTQNYAAPAPTTPTGLVASGGDKSVSLSWSAGTGDTKYNVYRAGVLVRAGLTATSFVDTGLSSGTAYTYHVTGVNADGVESTPTADVTATTNAAPLAPTGLTVGAVTGNSVALSWDSVSGASSYSVYNADTGSLVVSGLSGTTYTVSGLSSGTSYRFAVSASSSAGESAKSAAVSVSTLSKPSAPTGLTSSNAAANSMDLSWNAVSGADSYTLYNMYTGLVIASGLSGTSYHWTGLSDSTTYQVAVSATNSVGEGPKSTTVSAATLSRPTAPTGVTGTAGDSSATITWQPVTGAQTYNIYRDGKEIASGGTDASYTDSGLKDGQTYTYQVSAVNSVGESALSVGVTVTPTLAPQPVSGLVLQAGKTLINVQWGGSMPPYTVKWSLKGQNQWTSYSTSQNSYAIGNLQASTDYDVTVTDSNGNVVSASVNTGNTSMVFKPSMPDQTPVIQKMVDVIGTAAGFAVKILLYAVMLGCIVYIAIICWRWVKAWLHRGR